MLNGGSGALGVAQDVARGALGNAAAQGVAVATGLQSKFNFVGVAVGGAVGGAVGTANFGGLGGRVASGIAGALAGGAMRSLLDGSDFGDNILAALPDVIGTTVGEMVAGTVIGSPKETSMARNRRRGGIEIAQAVQSTGGNIATDAIPNDPRALTGEIVVTAQRPSWIERLAGSVGDGLSALWQWSGGDHLVDRLTMSISQAGSGADAIVSDIMTTNRNYYGNVYNQILGPGSAYQRYIGQPVVRAVTPVLTAIADSPLADPQVGMAAQEFHPAARLPGAGLVIVQRGLQAFASGSKFIARVAPAARNAVPLVDAAERSFLSVDEFAALPRTGTIEPNLIRFSQDSAGASFKAPFGSVDDFATGLANKSIDPLSVAPVRIAEKDGMIFTLDNRRLYAFQQAGKEIPYAKLDAIPKRELFKFTTQNNGESILIRRGK